MVANIWLIEFLFYAVVGVPPHLYIDHNTSFGTRPFYKSLFGIIIYLLVFRQDVLQNIKFFVRHGV
jgi:hypothetical protein